jgi:ABC-type sugar transport system substrate-binding protein
VILVQSVAGEGLERVARAAVRTGIGWVPINRQVEYLERLRRDHPTLPITAVGIDQVEIGRIQGRQFRKLLPEGHGLVLYVQGPADTSAARGRLAGASAELESTGIELKVVEGQWTEASGEQVVSRWLRLKQYEKLRPDVVGCQNDAMAVGARRALASDPAVSRMPITGVDGLPSGGQRLVTSGELAATVIVPPSTGPAVRLVAEFLLEGARLPEQVVLQPTPFPEVGDLVPAASRHAG